MQIITFDEILRLTRNRLGKHDVACPACGPTKQAQGARRPVLRVWVKDDGFATYHCVRCGLKGSARAGTHADSPAVDPAIIARARIEAERRDADEAAQRHRIALSLWDRAHPAEGTIVSTYLRSRDIAIDSVPATLRLLRATPPKYPFPAMVAAFGLPEEPEPGILHMPRSAVQGVHLTLLRADGGGKASAERDKVMIGRSAGWPIVLAAPNDGLGLIVAEGIETALSARGKTGRGAWAAGSAGRMPGLAERVPSSMEVVTIAADADADGQRGALELADRLASRGIEVLMGRVTNAA